MKGRRRRGKKNFNSSISNYALFKLILLFFFKHLKPRLFGEKKVMEVLKGYVIFLLFSVFLHSYIKLENLEDDIFERRSQQIYVLWIIVITNF